MPTGKNKKPQNGNMVKLQAGVSKEQLAKTVIDRSYGVLDLERYIDKIKKNIKVFEDAITREKAEMNRVSDMITVLKKDIKEAKKLERFAR